MKTFTRDELRALAEAVRQRYAYIVRVHVRLGKVGVLPGEAVYKLTEQAESALQRLRLHLHYQGAEGQAVRRWERGTGEK